MIKLNLTAETPEHDVLKAYLEENASPTLVEKIENGVKIVKDGKTLICKKDLAGFMKYACEEARKLAAKNATGACVKDDIVFGWLIHYFEEDGIEGKLYNEDGTPYKQPKKQVVKTVQRKPATPVQAKPTPSKPAQFSLFDMLTEEKKEEPVVEETSPPVEEPAPEIEETTDDVRYFDEEDVDRETGEILRFKTPDTQRGSSLYQNYMKFQEKYPLAVIAYRLGDFFEVFGKYAVRVANELDLTQTGRDCGLDERVPMVGFPYHAADTYFRKITERHDLVVVEDGNATLYHQTEPEEPIKQENEPTVYENNDENDDFEEARALQQFFDKDALCALYELFDYNLDMQ